MFTGIPAEIDINIQPFVFGYRLRPHDLVGEEFLAYQHPKLPIAVLVMADADRQDRLLSLRDFEMAFQGARLLATERMGLKGNLVSKFLVRNHAKQSHVPGFKAGGDFLNFLLPLGRTPAGIDLPNPLSLGRQITTDHAPCGELLKLGHLPVHGNIEGLLRMSGNHWFQRVPKHSRNVIVVAIFGMLGEISQNGPTFIMWKPLEGGGEIQSHYGGGVGLGHRRETI